MSNRNWIAAAFCAACLVGAPVRAQDVSQAAPVEAKAVTLAYLAGLAVSDTGVALNEKAVVNYGAVTKGQSLLSVPFTYAHVVRAKQDIIGTRRLGPLSKQETVLEKGTVGFEGSPAAFANRAVSYRMFCFFRYNYSQPNCYAAARRQDGIVFYWASTMSNLPRDYVSNDLTGIMVTGTRVEDLLSMDEPDITDHTFEIDMIVKTWDAQGITIVWRSEKMDVLPPLKDAIPFGPDGVARIRLPVGLVAIKPEDGRLIVTQSKSGQAAN